MRRIDELHLRYPFAGARMLRDLLRQEGHAVGRRQVATLMRRMGIMAIYRMPRTSQRHPAHRIYPYLLRQLTITRPNHVWASDITYIPMAKGFVYLAVVLDVFVETGLLTPERLRPLAFLQISGSAWSVIQLTTVSEALGHGKQLLRCRLRPQSGRRHRHQAAPADPARRGGHGAPPGGVPLRGPRVSAQDVVVVADHVLTRADPGVNRAAGRAHLAAPLASQETETPSRSAWSDAPAP